MESRLGYDGEEGIYFDRERPSGEEDHRGPLYEECDPIEVCDELERTIRDLRALHRRAVDEREILRTYLKLQWAKTEGEVIERFQEFLLNAGRAPEVK